MFQKGNTESKKGGKKSAKLLLKKLGNPEAVSKHFKNLAKKRKPKRNVL